MKAHAGFTSVEFTLGASLLLVAIGVFASVQKAIMGLLTNTSADGMIGEKALGVMEKASSELKWAEGGSLLITSENGASRLDLRVPTDCVSGSPVWSNTITYKVEPSTIDANRDGVLNEFRLVRLQSGTPRVLCENVVPGGFTAVLCSTNARMLGGWSPRCAIVSPRRTRSGDSPRFWPVLTPRRHTMRCSDSWLTTRSHRL